VKKSGVMSLSLGEMR